MTTELQTKLERIKAECRQAIEITKETTVGPWPASAARALLTAIEALGMIRLSQDESGFDAEEALERICEEWPE